MQQDEHDSQDRGVAHRGIEGRGTSNPAVSSRRPKTRITQGVTQPSAPFPRVAPSNRTIFVADTGPFKALPRRVCASAIAELTRLYQFVGSARNQKAMTVRLLEPSKFPEVFAFSDAVVAATSSSGDLQAHVNEAIRIQVENAVVSLSQQHVAFTNPFSKTSRATFDPERTGWSQSGKFVQSGRAFPFMASVVSLDEIMSDFVEEAGSKIDEKKVRKHRADLDPRYWGKARALRDTAILTVLDNPKDPTQWIWNLTLFGELIGRAMAHEVRHLYVGAGHARDGLGADAAALALKSSSAFSREDRARILKSIQNFERQQGRNPVVPTFPSSRRTDFPF